MEVDCSLVISEGTWQAVATGLHQGWDCSLMHESPYSERKKCLKCQKTYCITSLSLSLGESMKFPLKAEFYR